MALRFRCIDPGTTGNECPSFSEDDETGDMFFQGGTVTDPKILGGIAEHSPIASDESVVRLPARMRPLILKALLEGQDDGGSAAL